MAHFLTRSRQFNFHPYNEDIYELIYQKQAAINEAIDHQTSTEKVQAISIREFVDEMLKRRGRR